AAASCRRLAGGRAPRRGSLDPAARRDAPGIDGRTPRGVTGTGRRPGPGSAAANPARTPSPASHRGRLLPPLAAARLRFSPLSCPFARPSVIIGEPSGESSSGGAIMKRLGVFILLFFSAAGVHAQDPAAIAAVRDAD